MTDPAKTLDYSSGEPSWPTSSSNWIHFWENPVGWPITIVSVAFPCLMFLVAMNGGNGGGLLSPLHCLAVPMWIAGLTWAVRNVVRLLISITHGFRDPCAKRFGRHTAVFPIAVLVTAIALNYQWPMRVGFLLAKPSMERAIAASTPGKPPPFGWYGLYSVDKVIELQTGGYFFVLPNEGWMDPEYLGFYYHPSPTPPVPTALRLNTNWHWTTAQEPELDR